MKRRYMYKYRSNLMNEWLAGALGHLVTSGHTEALNFSGSTMHPLLYSPVASTIIHVVDRDFQGFYIDFLFICICQAFSALLALHQLY